MSTTEKFEHYEVQRREDGSLFELGRGAMGITYKALDIDLQCTVALKIINPSTIANADAEQRFLREARSAAQLRHPNIAAVYRLGKTGDGAHYYAMEFCEGETLQQIVDKTGPIDCKRALQFTIQVAKALALAEEHKLVHRDVKPSNLIITKRVDEGEVVKVIDFGLAKNTKSDDTMWSSLGTHGFIGTAHFASPEQIEEKSVDTRSDIYSLGATLWFMLLGRPPFEGSLARIMSQHLTSSPDFSLLAGEPERVVALVRRMMEKDIERRPQTARALLAELKGCMEEVERMAAAGEDEPTPIPELPPSPDVISPPPLPPAGSNPGVCVPGAPHPDPSQEEVPPEPPLAWAPSFLDLLRARSVLAPVEALRLCESLAALLDAEDSATLPQGSLMIQAVIIRFRDALPESTVRGKLREHVTTWPPFNLLISHSEARSEPVTTNQNEMMTIVPGDKFTGDRVQQLAQIFYELLGGNASGRYVPLASLGEAGNSHLRRARAVGAAAFPQALDLVNSLRSATAGAAGPAPISSVAPVVTPPPLRPVSSPSPTGPSNPVLAADSSALAPNPAPPAQKLKALSPTAPSPGRARPKSSTLESTIVLVSAVISLVIICAGIYLFKRHFHHDRYRTYTDSQTDNGASSSLDNANSNSGVTQPGPVSFTVYDHLGEGQISEIVWVYLDDQSPPIGSISLSLQQPAGSVVVSASTGGRHFVSAQTQTMAFDGKRGVRTLRGSGRWEAELRGGEQYAIECAPFGESDTYELKLVVKQ